MQSETTKAQNMIFQAMRDQFGEAWYAQVQRWQWPMWRRHINTMLFDEDIIASEAIAVIPNAVEKGKWPHGTGFFARVRDLCLVNRRERQRWTAVKEDRGLQSISSVLPVHKLP